MITDARGDWRSLFRAWDMTLLSNLIYGGHAFGCTELFERALREVLGSSSALLVPLLVLASFCASALAALAYSPFEALRIRVITACALAGAEDPGIVAAFQQVP